MKIVVIGAGSIGARHAMNLLALGVSDVILTDPNQARLQEVATKHNVKPVATLAEALKEKPQGAVVCTPPHLHLQTALEAVRAGCHCFIEKPIADRVEGLDGLFAEAKARRLNLLVGYNMRYLPGITQVRDLLAQNSAGRIFYVRSEVGSYLPDWRPWQDYRQSYTSKKEMGGGVILDASHEIDLVRFLMGEVSKVFCAAGKLSDLEVEVEDTAEITMWFQGGVLGNVHMDLAQRARSRTTKLVGTKGTIICDLDRGWVDFYSAEKKEWERTQHPLENNQTYIAETSHFLKCISGEESPKITGEDGKRALEIALAAKQSAASEAVVTLTT